MHRSRLLAITLSACALLAGNAHAGKKQEVERYRNKPWNLGDLPALAAAVGDANEVEPNNTCPGNGYTEGVTYHGAISPASDVDWVMFQCSAGEIITVGTDRDDPEPMVDTFLELYASDCSTMLASNDDGGPGLYSLIQSFVAPYTGTYHLKVRAFGSDQVGNYLLMGNFDTIQPGMTCPTNGYMVLSNTFSPGLAIPDDNAKGLVTPPLAFDWPPGHTILDVVVDLRVSHSWMGDLTIVAEHKSTGGEVRSVPLVAQALGGTCSADLVESNPDGTENWYSFGAAPGLDPLGIAVCPGPDEALPGGCYAVSPESVGGLEVFDGIEVSEGEWSLRFIDSGPDDFGMVYGWSIHLLDLPPPLAVEEVSWGRIKAGYRD